MQLNPLAQKLRVGSERSELDCGGGEGVKDPTMFVSVHRPKRSYLLALAVAMAEKERWDGYSALDSLGTRLARLVY